MTLGFLFESEKLPKHLVEDLADAEGSDYWQKSFNFLEQNWDRDLEDLSDKQISWAHRLLEDLTEKRIMRR